MLGQKEICVLIIILCCSLARPLNTANCHDCCTCLRQEAENLENATKHFFGIPDNAEVISNISAQLPSCNLSQYQTHHVVKAFHALFLQLNATVEDAVHLGSLQTNLKQQEACLGSFDVSSFPVNASCTETTKEGRIICLVKAAERYNCLMQQNRDFCFWSETSADAAKGGR